MIDFYSSVILIATGVINFRRGEIDTHNFISLGNHPGKNQEGSKQNVEKDSHEFIGYGNCNKPEISDKDNAKSYKPEKRKSYGLGGREEGVCG